MRRIILCSVLLFTSVLAPCAQDKSVQALAPMAQDADPEFEVAVIKPTDPNDRNQGFHLNGHRISIENMPVTNLICFAYSIHKSQIVNAPQWLDGQVWNIDGVPDVAGVPNLHQYQRMVEKLLTTRFGLQMHHDKRELSVYVLTVAKGGPKLEKSKSDPDEPIDQTGNGKGTMKFTNNTMSDFALGLQFMVGKPVINQTSLSGRYDFTLRWSPDELRATEPDAAPGLFTAVQEELGLKLEATRAPTDVLVIDAATRPTQN
jgi:uncharacterized protein (TIGR03435 family)